MFHLKVNLAFVVLFFLVLPAFASDASGEFGGLDASLTMTIIMWICFLTLLVVGYKVAWGPILSQIDERESKISKSLEDAEKTQKELTNIKEECKTILHNAHTESKAIVVKAKKAAQNLASDINNKAFDEAKNHKDKAIAEIDAHKNATIQGLRKESAELAITIAGKILEKDIDAKVHQSLISKYTQEI